ncbi:sensor domain-containing diguanylate cyclase [Candidatus Xianfuyuplasma coldseepsis]|uniref:Sensor domain-containing diguanylate cyclase n=1 Tax=Candidatus Xianfuyuplasma coldseepsis TaxID=2782163 RepID=A0A7L7KPB3_9MOLU|nr:sensor domain-containing diguanylate cyclase [Xianfuyuplasma coldseepsis]QMS84259.1 sensor domain-containing diguanylate cyclase [Xianfuyuplasma coldseepsis]
MKTNVLLRETQEKVEVQIRDENKPVVEKVLVEKWQKLINLVASLLNVPAGLIMQITDTHMEVFLRSENEDNPYPSDGKDTLSHGLYCETVIGTDEALHIENSLHLEAWKDNPDVALNMISYYGLPIKWHDGTFFGTICALDSKTNEFADEYRQLMLLFKDIIEMDLVQLVENQQLLRTSEYDSLTNAYNRRRLHSDLERRIDAYHRYGNDFSLTMIDLDGFKYINDTYGHVAGDKVLMKFSEIIMNRIRKVDAFYRYGGDEFALILGNHIKDDIVLLLKSLQEEVKQDSSLRKYFIDFCYGIQCMSKDIVTTEDILTLADKDLYLCKKKKHE